MKDTTRFLIRQRIMTLYGALERVQSGEKRTVVKTFLFAVGQQRHLAASGSGNVTFPFSPNLIRVCVGAASI